MGFVGGLLLYKNIAEIFPASQLHLRCLSDMSPLLICTHYSAPMKRLVLWQLGKVFSRQDEGELEKTPTFYETGQTSSCPSVGQTNGGDC